MAEENQQTNQQGPSIDSSANERFCNLKNPGCAYFIPKHRARTFILALSAIVSIAVFYYAYSNYFFRASFNSIISYHKIYYQNLENDSLRISLADINLDSISDDSKIFLHQINREISKLNDRNKQAAASINTLLDIHYHRMSSDFDSLTLWAGVLMIVFLVFSFYSMYKMDEMQNKSSESAGKIYQAHADVTSKIRDFNEKMENELDRLKSIYAENVGKIKADTDANISGLNTVMEDTKKNITELQNGFESQLKELKSNFDKESQEQISNAINQIAKKNKIDFDKKVEEYILSLNLQMDTKRQTQSIQTQLSEASIPTPQNNTTTDITPVDNLKADNSTTTKNSNSIN